MTTGDFVDTSEEPYSLVVDNRETEWSLSGRGRPGSLYSHPIEVPMSQDPTKGRPDVNCFVLTLNTTRPPQDFPT